MVNRWKDLSVSRRIASKLVGRELPGWFLLMLQGLGKKLFGRSTISLPGHQNIDHVTILVHCSTEVVELATDLDEDLVHMRQTVPNLCWMAALHGRRLSCPLLLQPLG